MLVKRKKTGLMLMILLGITAAAAVAGWFFQDLLPIHRERFRPNTTLHGVDLSGLTLREAEAELRQAVSDYRLTVTFADGTETFSADELGLTVVSGRGLRTLLREDATVDELSDGADLLDCPTDKLTERLAELPALTARANVSNEDAKLCIDRENDRFWLREERVGGAIDAEELADAVSHAARHLEPELNAVTRGLYGGRTVRTKDNEELQKALKKAERFLDLNIRYHYGAKRANIDDTVDITRHQLAQFLRVEEDGLTVAVRGKQLREYVRRMANNYSGYPQGPAQFVTAGGKYVEVSAPATEIRVDEDALYEDLKGAIYNRKSGLREAPYESGPGGESGAADLGRTYVEVDLQHQHLYLYDDGKLAAEGDICSGSVADDNDTPEGLYAINDIDHDRYLRGNGYEEWVHTFMPYSGGYGLHDSTWREEDEYGGDVYLRSGSHGCINMPLELARKVDDTVSVGTKVILYGSGTAKDKWDGQTIRGSSSYVRELSDGGFTLSAYSEGQGELHYSSSDTDILTVNEDGWVSPVGTGKATVTVTADATETQSEGKKEIVILITDQD